MGTTLVAKSAVNKEQLENKREIGFEYIELQLMDDFISRSVEELLGVTKEVEGLTYVSVHAPLGKSAYNLEDLSLAEVKTSFRKMCEFANELGNRQGIVVDVILHSEFSNNEFKKFPEVKKQCYFEILQVLHQLHKINICLENLVPLIINKEGQVFLRNNFFNQNIEFAEELNLHFDSPRIFTVLDTCHMMATINFFKMLGLTRFFDKDIEDFFKANAGKAHIIHVCNAKGLALEDESAHGLPFDSNIKSDMYTLNIIIENWVKYTPEAKLVLEVAETNYLNCENSVKTKKSVEIVLNKQKIV